MAAHGSRQKLSTPLTLYMNVMSRVRATYEVYHSLPLGLPLALVPTRSMTRLNATPVHRMDTS